MKILKISIGAVLAIAIAGCAWFGKDPKPPTVFEQTIYDIATNLVPKVAFQTQTVLVPIEVLVYKTNEVGVIVQHTNVVTIPTYELVTVTNQVEAYTLTPKQSSKDDAAALGGISNMVVPGSGGLITGIGLALLAAWGRIRSSKNTGAVLAQNIEGIREFVKSLPDGAKYDSAIVDFLQSHQLEQDVALQVIELLKRRVSNKEALNAAEEIKNGVEALK